MTKEELKKKAEEYANNVLKDVNCTLGNPRARHINSLDIEEAYLAGAEPREKRIAELINLIHAERKRQEQCDDIHLRKIAELEAQIKKMKCCANCKYQCSFLFQDEIDCANNGFSKWEIKEK